MARYPNGRVPLDQLVEADGCYWFPGTRAKFVALRDRVKRSHGVTLYVSPRAYGASNAYRPIGEQEAVRAALGIGASIPGYSSHGGDWSGNTTGRYGLARHVEHVEAGAVDIANYNAIPWADFERACHEVGLLVNVTVPTELWHVVDLDPWGTETNTDKENNMSQDDSKSWTGQRIGGSINGPTITALLSEVIANQEWIKARIGGSVKNGSENLTEMIRGVK